MAMSPASHQAWLDQLVEDVIEPDWPIVDPHHHLWQGVGGPGAHQPDYMEAELHADLESGHDVVATVYLECGQHYRTDGPPALRPVGETAFVDAFADAYRSRHGSRRAVCAGIVGHADLRLGERVREVLAAHAAAAPARLRGIRQMTVWDADPKVTYRGSDIARGLLLDRTFRAGFACLRDFDLSFDAWLLYPQLGEMRDLAMAFPDTQIIVDHMGGPLGIGSYAGRRDEVFAAWKQAIADLARCDNVALKLGGMQMKHTGFYWHRQPLPPTSAELAAATRDYYLHAIDCFGPQRCMFESNFPVDKLGCSYRTLWNVFKLIGREFSAGERDALLHRTARRVYRIDA